MVPIRRCPVFAVSLLAAGVAGAQVPDGEWVSYRDAYRAMVVFEKFGGPKHLIQNHFQVMPRRLPAAQGRLRRECRAGAEPRARPVRAAPA